MFLIDVIFFCMIEVKYCKNFFLGYRINIFYYYIIYIMFVESKLYNFTCYFLLE